MGVYWRDNQPYYAWQFTHKNLSSIPLPLVDKFMARPSDVLTMVAENMSIITASGPCVLNDEDWVVWQRGQAFRVYDQQTFAQEFEPIDQVLDCLPLSVQVKVFAVTSDAHEVIVWKHMIYRPEEVDRMFLAKCALSCDGNWIVVPEMDPIPETCRLHPRDYTGRQIMVDS